MRLVTIQLKNTSPENIFRQNEMLDKHGIALRFTEHADYSLEELEMTSEELEEIFTKPLGSLQFNPQKSNVAKFFSTDDVEMYGFDKGRRIPYEVPEYNWDKSEKSIREENARLKAAIKDIVRAEIDHTRNGDPYQKLVECIIAANKIASE